MPSAFRLGMSSGRHGARLARRAVLTILILASMVLITATYRGGAVLHGAQLAVLDVVAPIERGLVRAWAPIDGAWSWGGRLLHATSENPRLQAENAQLRESVRIARSQEAELQRLRRTLAYDQTFQFPDGFDRVHARVIVRPSGSVARNLTIDRGADDGIAVDDAVMVPGGLLGRVVDTTGSTSVIALIISDSQQVSAAVVGSDAIGVLRATSTEGAPVMQLDYVDQRTEVERFDLVETSGLSTIYPRGIPIGEVDSVGNDPADTDKTVQVRPFADFDRIDELFVLVPAIRSGGS